MPKTANNATQTDALEQHDEETSTESAETQASNPRMSAMEAIAEQRRASLASDGVDVSQMESINPAAAAAAEVETDDTQLAAQLAQDEKTSLFADDHRLVKVKIDGEEREMPLSEVVKSYQKDAAASKRLQEATRLHNEATQLLKIAEQKASGVAQTVDTENNSPNAGDLPAQNKELMVGKIKGAASKLYEGDEEGFATDIAALIENAGAAKVATPQVIDTAAIVGQVTTQLEVNSAYGQVKSDYPAIFASDERGVVLGRATFDRMTAKEAAGTPKAQAMREASEEVATLFGIQKSGRQAPDPARTARETKLARKADLDIPESANVVAAGANAPAEAPNVSAVIAEMASRRLGQSLARR